MRARRRPVRLGARACRACANFCEVRHQPVSRSRVARGRSIPRRARDRGRRELGAAARLLYGRHRGRGVEDGGRRADVAARLRQVPHRRVRRGARGGAVRSQCRLRRHGGVPDSRQPLAGRRPLQVHRRRQDVEKDRARRRGPDRPRPSPSAESRSRVRRRVGSRIRPERHARRVPDQGRRQDVGQSPVSERQHGGDRPRARSRQPANPVCGALAGGATSLGAGVGWSGQWGFQVHRRRRQLDGDHPQQGPAQGDHREDGPRRLASRPRAGLGAGRGGFGRAVPLGRRRRELDAHQRGPRDPPARLVLHARVRRSRELRRRVRAQHSPPQVDRRRQDIHDAAWSPWGPPRAVDRPARSRAHDQRQRWRSDD